MQQIVPMLAYEDGPAALDWLTKAFGFREVTRGWPTTAASRTASSSSTTVS